MRILITGINGFVGSHLAEMFLSKGYTVAGIVRQRADKDNIRQIEGKLKLYSGDIKDSSFVNSTIANFLPDRIFHLAAISFVFYSFSSPSEVLATGILGQTNILEAVRAHKPDARVLVIGSSEEYGLVHPDEVPIKETNPLRPLSPYAISKIAQDFMGYQYFKSYGLHVVRTRAFNHSGARRGEAFCTSSFAKQVAEIKLGLREPKIYVGNLDAIRDFTDVRDVIRAYALALEKGDPGEVYNICSGNGYSIKQVLDMLIQLGGLLGTVDIIHDPARMRPSDVPVLIGDSTKFRERTGWQPDIHFQQTMSDLLNYWVDKLGGNK